jgi:glycosyltransferase involved in cell wall biosynthesis
VISFIVPAHDEERLLGATLEALAHSAAALDESSEIIVVDDASIDGTAAIARARNVRVVRVDARHIAAARNAGAQARSGDLLVFVDADTLVNPAVVLGTVGAMRGGAGGGGAMVTWDGTLPIWARALARLTQWSMSAATIAAGCYVFATRTAFDAVGGFDTRLYATEEIALSHALKKCGRFVILREQVITSGRKLRTHSIAEFTKMSAAVMIRGLRGVKDRRHLSLRY